MLGDGATPVSRPGSIPSPLRAGFPRSYFSRSAMPSDMQATAPVENPYFRRATRTSPSDDESHAPLPISVSRRELPLV